MKKIISFTLAFALLVSTFTIVPFTANAANGSNLVSVALKYKEYTQSQMGFSSAWCDLFIIRCAREAGVSNAIPNKPGCTNLYNAVLNAGGSVVSTPVAGDLAFYRYSNGVLSHVAIVTDSNYNTVHGNVTWCKKTGKYTSAHVCTRSKGEFERAMGCSTIYVRPKYTTSQHTHSYTSYYGYQNTHPHELIYSCSCGARTAVKNTKYYYDKCSICKTPNIKEGWYRIALTQNRTYVFGASIPKGSAQQKIQLQKYDFESDAQKVYIKYVGNGMYTVHFKKYGKNLDVKNADGGSGVNVGCYTPNGTTAQEFAFIKADNGGYYIKPRCGWNTLLDLYSNKVSNGTDIWTYTANFSVAQNWTLIPESQTVRYDANGGKATVKKVCTYANGINKGRGNNELIIYNKSGINTGTNIYGTEAIVDDTNKVVAIKAYGANNSTVPSGKGFVISGHVGENIAWESTKSTWIAKNVKVGNYITYDPETLKITVYADYNSYKIENSCVTHSEKIGTLPKVTRSGYKLKGWYTSKSGGGKINSSSVNVGGTLYAQWAEVVNPSVSGSKNKTYNGKSQTQSLVVKIGKKALKRGKDYDVSYTNNKYVGKAYAKVTLKGNYAGSKTISFTIKPKATAIKAVSVGKKKLTVKWNKQSSQTTGYQIQYSTSKKFSDAKTVTVSNNKTTSKTLSKLKGKKTYYIRVRTYKTVGKTKYYSAWSSAVSKKTKK